MEIIEYCSKYDDNIKDLLYELQEYVASIDREKYNIVTEACREENFKATMEELDKNNGKLLLASVDSEIVGFICGIILEAEDSCDFKAPKGGRVTELIVTKNCRAKGIGQALLDKMIEYFKSMGGKRVVIEIFEYNDIAKNFYYKNKYFNRVVEVMKKI